MAPNITTSRETSKKNIAANVATAIAPCIVRASALLATLCRATITRAMTTGFNPLNIAAIHGKLPKPHIDHAQRQQNKQGGSTKSVPATMPPRLPCSFQPM